MGEIDFTWTIKDFDMCPQPPGHAVESPCFSIDADGATKFSLLLYPRGHDKEATGETYVSLYLKRHYDGGKEDIKLNFRMYFIDKQNIDGKRSDHLIEIDGTFRKNEFQGRNDFFKREHLLVARRLPNTSEIDLTVHCEIRCNEDEGNKTQIYEREDYRDLSSNLNELLESGSHSDIAVRVGGKEFKAHRVILETRCPRLIGKLVKLENSNTFSLPTMEASVFHNILKYIYTGTYGDDSNLEDVLVASNAEALSDLKSSLFPAPCFSTAITEINVLHVKQSWHSRDISELRINENRSCYLFSNERPEWSWLKISLIKVKHDAVYALKFKRMCKNESILFMQIALRCVTSENRPVIFKQFGHLFENDCEWKISINLLRACSIKILIFNVRMSACSPNSDQSESLSENKYILQYKQFSLNFDADTEFFQKHLRDLHRNMKNADVTLRVGSLELPAHKTILSCRSEVFSKMFEHDTKENQTGVVDIVDADESTMASLLMYMYCGDIDVPLCLLSAIKLYTAADKYKVLLLKDKCRRYLEKEISTETVGDVLSLAGLHQDDPLKQSCYAFVTSHSDEILKDENCLNALTNGFDLYPDILQALLRRISES